MVRPAGLTVLLEFVRKPPRSVRPRKFIAVKDHPTETASETYRVQYLTRDRWRNYRNLPDLEAAVAAMRQNDRLRGRDTPWRVVDARGKLHARNKAAERLPLG